MCYSLFKRCRNLPARHCVTMVKAVLAMSESTCRALCYSDAGCLSGVGSLLPGTALQGFRLFKKCQVLPGGHCVAGMQTVSVVSEPTRWALFFSGAGCLSGVRTCLPSTVLQWCRLFKRCQYIPARHCVTGVQAV